MHINTLRKIMSWQLLAVIAISITISGFGQVLLSATAYAAVAPPPTDGNAVPTPPKGQATWFYNPEPCAQGGISADAALAYTYDDTTSDRGKTIVLHCSFIMSTFNQDYMELDGPTDCTQSPISMRVGKDVDHQQNTPLATSTQGTLQLSPRSTNGTCTGGRATINVKLTNTYAQGSVPPPPVNVGTAVWSKENPAELKATYNFKDANYSQTNELFDQLDGAVNGNAMTLTSTKKAASQCAPDQITLGSRGGNYLTDKSPEQPPIITIYLWGYEGGSDQHCYTRTGSLTLTQSYQQAGGKAVSPTTTTDSPCPIDGSAGLLFLLCPVYDLGKQTVQALNTQIENLLYINVDQIFGTATFRNSYNTFRNIGLSLLVVAGLVMVISQAAGLDIFSAYTIRKALPRIVLAAIGIALAWPLLQFAVTFFNDLGSWISSVILVAAPAQSPHSLPDIADATIKLMFTVVAGSAVIFTFGVLGGLSFLLTAVVALLLGAFFLVVRQLVIIVCILLAPLAIASSVLPGTEKLWKFWRETLEGALLMFPLVMGFLSAGAALSAIAGAAAASGSGNSLGMNILALIAYFVPYFLIPVAFRMASGLLGNVFSIVNDRGKGVFDRLTKYRAGEKEYYHNRRMEGKSGLDRIGKGGLGRWYRRAHTRGGLAITPNGLARTRRLDQSLIAANADKAVKEAGAILGDDEALRLASREDMSREKFVNEYTRITGRSAGQAREALGAVETAFGQLGSAGAKVGAWKALVASNTGYEAGAEGVAKLRNDARRMIDRGYLSKGDAMTIAKTTNPTRTDFNGPGWSAWSTALDAPGVVNGRDQVITDMLDSALSGQQIGRVLSGHDNAVKTFAPRILSRVQENGRKYQEAIARNDPNAGEYERAYYKSIADVASIQDVQGSLSSNSANELADQLMRMNVFVPEHPETEIQEIQTDPTDPKTKRQIQVTVIKPASNRSASAALDVLRDNPLVLERRREYRTGAAAWAAAAGAAAAGAAGTTPPPGTP